MTVTQVEQFLTEKIASAIGGTVDVNVFRGDIPSAIGTGLAVRLENEVLSSVPHVATYTFQVAGKYLTRDAAWNVQKALSLALPSYGDEKKDASGNVLVTFVSVLPRGEAVVYEDADGALTKYFVSVNGYVSAR